MLPSIAIFLVCGVTIFFAGRRLSYYWDLLAKTSGMGRAWLGLILMAAVASLPELIVVSADLAVGDLIGSCAINLGILAMMDIFTSKDRPLFGNVAHSQILAAAFGIIIFALLGLSLYFDKDIVITPFVGLTSISFMVVYLIAVQTIFNYQQNNTVPVQNTDERSATPFTLKQVAIRHAFFALIIIIAALPFLADHLAKATGLGKSFVGTLYVAATTSLPEIAVSLAAIRTGFTDMAVGNLLGSDLFNEVILFLDDNFYSNGHLLKDASDVNLLSAFFVIMMSSAAIIAFIFPGKEKNL